MLRILWDDHRTNIFIIQEFKIPDLDRHFITVKSQILKFFGHVIRRDGNEKDTTQGKFEGMKSRGKLIRPN